MTRQERQQIRLTGTSYAVLTVVRGLGHATTYAIARTLEEKVSSFWPVPRTTSYGEPKRLAAAGFLSETLERHGRRRRLYRLTSEGHSALELWAAKPECPPPEIYDEGLLKIFAGAHPAPLLRARLEWHSSKISDLDRHLARASGQPDAGPTVTLCMGLQYHNGLSDAISAYLEGRDRSAISPTFANRINEAR